MIQTANIMSLLCRFIGVMVCLGTHLAYGQGFLLTNARIVDTEQQQITRGHIWIQADTIVKVFDQLPESFGGEQIDLAEKYVIPGLYDMHTHSWGNLAP
ncbi:MAG: hypothetical protein AAF388_03655, partial [Bacteroidota bacterium]